MLCFEDTDKNWRRTGRAAIYRLNKIGLNKKRAEKLPHVPVISIIDDDHSVREATSSLVQSLGYNTATFGSAEEYLCSGRLAEFSCVITDLHMPGLSGAELQSQLLADGYRTPIIFMTSFAEDRIRARVLRAGAFGFLDKPVDDRRLIECLDEALVETRHLPMQQ